LKKHLAKRNKLSSKMPETGKNNMRKTIIYSSLILFLTGCNLAPKYERPQAPVPAEWPTGPSFEFKNEANVPEVFQIKWQEFFTDEKLQKVIETALANNRDLRIAALNVERARAQYGIQRADLLPTIDAQASHSRQRIPGDLSMTGKSIHPEQYNVDLGAAWEIDFFGRLHNLEEQALQEYFATEQARRSAQIVLIAEVASTYLTFAADRENLQLAQSTLGTQQAAYNLIKRRFETGIAPELDLRQIQTRVDAAQVDVYLYTRLVAQDEAALNLLVGSTVPSQLLPDTLSSISQPTEISPGLSSEVLLSRPDILQAENQLKAANANIGAARAAFFPRIALTTSYGTASSELSGLFKSGSDTWIFNPQIVMPIFDTHTWFALDFSKANREIAQAQYEKSIQQAFKEVVDSLAVKGTVEEQISAQKSLVEATAETYRLSNARYMKGIDNYLVVIDSQRSLYASQQGLVSLRLTRIANQVKLYAVLGGGADSLEQISKNSLSFKGKS
jgi:multidrug efflux system outer membrane protein